MRPLIHACALIVVGLCWAGGNPASAEVSICARIDQSEPLKMNRVGIRVEQKCRLVAVMQLPDAAGAFHYYSGTASSALFDDLPFQIEAWPADQPPPQIHWFKVEPKMMHAEKGNDPTVPGYLWYTNAYTPASPNGQRWIGFDKIEYVNNPLPQFDGRWEIPADAHPTDPKYDRNAGLGTMRYAVEIGAVDKKWRTADASATDYLGIEQKVFKLLVREDDTFVGHATSWFNVPGVFGSHRLQVDRHLGVDCADLVVGAYRQWKNSKIEYTSVNGLTDYMDPASPAAFLAQSGKVFAGVDQAKESDIAFEKGLAIKFDYPGSSENWYDHVGILYRDNGNGLIDGEDVFLQCGPMEATLSRLSTQAFHPTKPTRFQLLRWKQ